MADQNKVETSEQGNEETKAKRIPVKVVEYETREEAEANRPVGADAEAWKVFTGKYPDGKVVHFWAVGSVNAKSQMADRLGCEVSQGGSRGPRKATMNAALTDEQIAAYSALPDAALKTLALEEAVWKRINAFRAASKPATAANPPVDSAPSKPKRKGS